MKTWRYPMLTAGIALVILLLATACTPSNPFRASSVDESRVEIVAPANFSTTARDSTIAIRALVEDPRGIKTVQLRVDGEALVTEVPSSAPVTTHLTQELYWTPRAVGPHEIRVVAQNNDDEWLASEPITLEVVEVLAQATTIAAQLTTVQAASSPPTPVPACPACYCPPLPPPYPVPPPGTCYDNAAYVADVTVPDGTLFDRGVAFNKTWRLRNIGTCTWHTGYQLVFVGGSQMNAPNAVNLPHDVPPGATVDITVPMVAPNTTGTYRGNWQMRNPECLNLFGSVVYVQIRVRPGSGDLPVINRFEVVPNVINQGQSATIYWEYVNGTSAYLYPDGQAVGPSGSRAVSPNATTNYRLVVTNAAGSAERTATLTVQPPPTPPSPPASPANLTVTGVRPDGFDLTWIDASANEQGFRLYNADTQQVMATYGPNLTGATVGGLACGTPYRFYLVAFNEGGESWPSNTVLATTGTCG